MTDATTTATDAAQATAEWWAEQCFGRAPGRDIGLDDSPQSGITAAVLALSASIVPTGTDAQRAKFVDATARYLRERLATQASSGFAQVATLSSDYGPGREWDGIIAESGIHVGAFPYKTRSFTYRNRVTAAAGYGATEERVWTAEAGE